MSEKRILRTIRRQTFLLIQSRAIRWPLGCVNSRPTARGIQDAGFTQPRDDLICYSPSLYYILTLETDRSRCYLYSGRKHRVGDHISGRSRDVATTSTNTEPICAI